MLVTKVVDLDVADKVDAQYIEEHLGHVPNVGIIYICTSEGGEEDEWIDEKTGMRRMIIHLPYNEVKRMADARPLMLQKAKDRLGLVSTSSLN
jgi:hypothetical protein